MKVTFADALIAASGFPKTTATAADARKCIEALTVADVGDVAVSDCPAFRSVCKHLEEEYQDARTGALVVAILRARQPKAIVAWAEITAPNAMNGTAEERRRRATSLYADAYLLLDRWLVNWNRRGIKRVS